eukprot:gene6167-6405_t
MQEPRVAQDRAQRFTSVIALLSAIGSANIASRPHLAAVIHNHHAAVQHLSIDDELQPEILLLDERDQIFGPACAALAKTLKLVTAGDPCDGAKLLLQSASSKVVDFASVMSTYVAGLVEQEVISSRLSNVAFHHIKGSGLLPTLPAACHAVAAALAQEHLKQAAGVKKKQLEASANLASRLLKVLGELIAHLYPAGSTADTSDADAGLFGPALLPGVRLALTVADCWQGLQRQLGASKAYVLDAAVSMAGKLTDAFDMSGLQQAPPGVRLEQCQQWLHVPEVLLLVIFYAAQLAGHLNNQHGGESAALKAAPWSTDAGSSSSSRGLVAGASKAHVLGYTEQDVQQRALNLSSLVLVRAWGDPEAPFRLAAALATGSRQLNQQFLSLLTSCMKVQRARGLLKEQADTTKESCIELLCVSSRLPGNNQYSTSAALMSMATGFSRLHQVLLQQNIQQLLLAYVPKQQWEVLRQKCNAVNKALQQQQLECIRRKFEEMGPGEAAAEHQEHCNPLTEKTAEQMAALEKDIFFGPACAALAKSLQLVTTGDTTTGAKLLQSGLMRVVEFVRSLARYVADLLYPETIRNQKLDAIDFQHIIMSGLITTLPAAFLAVAAALAQLNSQHTAGVKKQQLGNLIALAGDLMILGSLLTAQCYGLHAADISEADARLLEPMLLPWLVAPALLHASSTGVFHPEHALEAPRIFGYAFTRQQMYHSWLTNLSGSSVALEAAVRGLSAAARPGDKLESILGDCEQVSAINLSRFVLAWECPGYEASRKLAAALATGSRQLNQQFLSLLTSCMKGDLLRPLALPPLLVGDPALGGISTTLCAYESLLLRGQLPLAVVMMTEGRYNNVAAVRKQLRHAAVH